MPCYIAVGSIRSIVAWCLRATAGSDIRHLPRCHVCFSRSNGCEDGIQDLM